MSERLIGGNGDMNAPIVKGAGKRISLIDLLSAQHRGAGRFGARPAGASRHLYLNGLCLGLFSFRQVHHQHAFLEVRRDLRCIGSLGQCECPQE